MKKTLFMLVMVSTIILAIPVAARVFNFADLILGEDVLNEYIYNDGYEYADVTIRYSPVMENFNAKINAKGLKPNFTYQVKLVATPSCAAGDDTIGDDITNELIGYAGRWYCPECDSSVVNKNRTDTQYEANELLSDDNPLKECIHGYLVFDYFNSNRNGVASADVVTDQSLHVLFCGGDYLNNTYLYEADTSLFSCDVSDLKCVTPLLCKADDVIGQIERSTFTQLEKGEYKDLKIALTEESFHQACGSWATVLWNDVEFKIER